MPKTRVRWQQYKHVRDTERNSKKIQFKDLKVMASGKHKMGESLFKK